MDLGTFYIKLICKSRTNIQIYMVCFEFPSYLDSAQSPEISIKSKVKESHKKNNIVFIRN